MSRAADTAIKNARKFWGDRIGTLLGIWIAGIMVLATALVSFPNILTNGSVLIAACFTGGSAIIAGMIAFYGHTRNADITEKKIQDEIESNKLNSLLIILHVSVSITARLRNCIKVISKIDPNNFPKDEDLNKLFIKTPKEFDAGWNSLIHLPEDTRKLFTTSFFSIENCNMSLTITRTAQNKIRIIETKYLEAYSRLKELVETLSILTNSPQMHNWIKKQENFEPQHTKNARKTTQNTNLEKPENLEI